jgi:hypothetical protein
VVIIVIFSKNQRNSGFIFLEFVLAIYLFPTMHHIHGQLDDMGELFIICMRAPEDVTDYSRSDPGFSFGTASRTTVASRDRNSKLKTRNRTRVGPTVLTNTPLTRGT